MPRRTPRSFTVIHGQVVGEVVDLALAVRDARLTSTLGRHARTRLLPFWEQATVGGVRVFNRSTVKAFAESHSDARQPLYAWFAELEKANWTGPEDIKQRYPSASIINKERVVFNIKGNTYRVVVAVKFEFHIVYIRFIGTHAGYDKIDAATI
ncbi:MAG: hypothetical protein RL701_6499 [Pseudomonadota bacterium]